MSAFLGYIPTKLRVGGKENWNELEKHTKQPKYTSHFPKCLKQKFNPRYSELTKHNDYRVLDEKAGSSSVGRNRYAIVYAIQRGHD